MEPGLPEQKKKSIALPAKTRLARETARNCTFQNRFFYTRSLMSLELVLELVQEGKSE
jgi:hypothetical protein